MPGFASLTATETHMTNATAEARVFRTASSDLPWVVVLGGSAEVIERTAAPAMEVPLAASGHSAWRSTHG
jgi:hypothetical protein